MNLATIAGILLFAGANASAATGVSGRVTVSPAHPGPQRSDESGSAPMQGASILVLDAQRSVVAHATTDADGRFYVTVTPGEYSVEVDVGKARLPRCGTVQTSVKDGEIAKVELECDSGMR
jgi:hypothetical protein